MGKFAAVMKSVLRALGSTGRYVWERCERTHAMIMRTIVAPVEVLFGGSAAGHFSVPFSPEMSFEDNVLQDRNTSSEEIKRAAAKMIAGDVTEKDIRGIPERIMRWLTVMNGRELSRIVGATHHQIESYVYGHKKLAGVLEFTESAVDARAEALAKEELEARQERKERRERMAENERFLEASRERRRTREADDDRGYSVVGYGV